MARYCIQRTARLASGPILASATVQVYLADTTTAVSIYSGKSGGTVISTGLTTTDTNGLFKFYVDSDTYPIPTEFDVVISKSGYSSVTLEDIWS